MVYIENTGVSENDGKARSRGGMRGENAKWPSIGKRGAGEARDNRSKGRGREEECGLVQRREST